MLERKFPWTITLMYLWSLGVRYLLVVMSSNVYLEPCMNIFGYKSLNRVVFVTEVKVAFLNLGQIISVSGLG